MKDPTSLVILLPLDRCQLVPKACNFYAVCGHVFLRLPHPSAPLLKCYPSERTSSLPSPSKTPMSGCIHAFMVLHFFFILTFHLICLLIYDLSPLKRKLPGGRDFIFFSIVSAASDRPLDNICWMNKEGM